MTFYQDPYVTIYNCSALELPLADESVQCVVTSPPYWGLRKYSGEQDLIWGGDNHHEHEWGEEIPRAGYRSNDSHPGKLQSIATQNRNIGGSNFCQICGAWHGAYGLEPTVQMYVDHTLLFLAKIWRVLRKDGVVFWNVGDSYSGGSRKSNKPQTIANGNEQDLPLDYSPSRDMGNQSTIKPKDLCLIPQRVALAAQEAGWWVRSVIIWSKSNPMPESVTDRPTDAYEEIIMLTKFARYYWDQEAVREPVAESTIGRELVDFGGAKGRNYTPDKTDPQYRGGNEQWGRTFNYKASCANGRNIRNVWEIATQPYPEAHFATFPEEIPSRCIRAATPPKCCAECGAPWERIVEKGLTAHDGNTETNYPKGTTANRLALLRQAARERGGEYQNDIKTLGWQPTCKCNAGTKPSLVLDPFGGSGTTGKVAKELGRMAVLTDTSAEYCKLAQHRIEQVPIPMDLGL